MQYRQGLIGITLAGLCLLSPMASAFDSQGFMAAMSQEKTVKDATITSTGAVYVGVIDDGSDRRGYAMYICEVARDYAGKPEERLVKIIDIVALVNDKGFKELGRYRCDL